MRTPDVELSLDDVDADRVHHAAMAAGDAAASAYPHPLAEATQVGHILRAAAHAALARSSEMDDGLLSPANDHLRDVLRRYPRPGAGATDVGRRMRTLDDELRA